MKRKEKRGITYWVRIRECRKKRKNFEEERKGRKRDKNYVLSLKKENRNEGKTIDSSFTHIIHPSLTHPLIHFSHPSLTHLFIHALIYLYTSQPSTSHPPCHPYLSTCQPIRDTHPLFYSFIHESSANSSITSYPLLIHPLTYLCKTLTHSHSSINVSSATSHPPLPHLHSSTNLIYTRHTHALIHSYMSHPPSMPLIHLLLTDSSTSVIHPTLTYLLIH